MTAGQKTKSNCVELQLIENVYLFQERNKLPVQLPIELHCVETG